MKVGDKRQALVLGFVAIFAVVLLAKTTLGSLGGGSSNKPIPIRDASPHIGTESESIEPSPDTNSTPPQTAIAPTNNLPTKEDVTQIKRDAFQKPNIPIQTKGFDPPPMNPNVGTTENQSGPETSTQTGSIQGNIGFTDPQDKPGLPKAKQAIKSTTSIRFDGYVEAGSPMGIITYNKSSMSVATGDTFGDGFIVESVSSHKIIVRKNKDTKSISIGQEIHI
ncbi:MAG: hypothetical protein WCG75_11850, partial [Armatimonadota bacterium]